MRRTSTKAAGTVRVIGGRWRGRKLQFTATNGLRPTPDRVRETLFNWLAADIGGAHCLDLFAGSGALGIEALSRGAASCQFVDLSGTACQHLTRNLTELPGVTPEVFQADAMGFLNSQKGPFDLVFLDPPFGSGLLGPCLDQLLDSHALAEGGAIYVESSVEEALPQLPPPWTLCRDKKAGQVCYRLYREHST